ncbi:unnamed protein product [Durusdinium trenchii]|uniref:Acyl-CoA dehydrogenase n=1 Tax=Durusdinium trenchii TaxID=1381693 RepID=A0ABP0MFL0_9DINO
MKTTAVKDGDEYVLNGAKMWITNGTVDGVETGDAYLVEASVYARTGKGSRDVSLFLVEKGMKGFSLGQKIEDKCGMRASMTAELVFQDCRVPASNLVGEEGKATLCMMRNLEIERVALAAMSLGIARRCVEEMNRYAKERHAFGAQLNSFGQIQRFLAESFAEYQAGRSYVYQVARNLKLDSVGNGLDADGVKLYCGQMGKNVADRAIQVMGGYGYVGEYNVERLWRDAKLLEIGGGTNEAHHKNIVRDLSRQDSARVYTCGVLSAWLAFGFLHGGHWCVLSGMASNFGHPQRWLLRNHAISYAVGILLTAAGGAYCQSGTAKPCPGGEDMSRDCFWQEQTVLYQIIYILHYVGLAWNFAHWIMDGVQLLFWSQQIVRKTPLRLVLTDFPLSKFLYSGILSFAVLMATLTWTWWMEWSTGIAETPNESTLPRLAGVIFAEILCILVVACAAPRSCQFALH